MLALLEKFRLPTSCSSDALNLGKEKVLNSMPPTVLVKVVDRATTAGRKEQMEMALSRRTARLVVLARWRRHEDAIALG
jgi:hypothetical protein